MVHVHDFLDGGLQRDNARRLPWDSEGVVRIVPFLMGWFTLHMGAPHHRAVELPQPVSCSPEQWRSRDSV